MGGLNLFYKEIRNNIIWKEIEPNRWKKYYPQLNYKNYNKKEMNIKNLYKVNSKINDKKKDKYIIFGKGI